MRASSTLKVLRSLIIPIATITGVVVTPALVGPSADELRRARTPVDGTGYGSAALLGIFLGALGGYILRAVLDHFLWSEPEDDDVRRDA